MDQVYSVSQINQYIKNMFTRDYALNNIYMKGEVSNCKYHTSGHIYFTLKDSKGQIACVMFAGQRSGLSFHLSEGQSVIALGSINVYERDGKYQFYARELIQEGSGLLYQKFEELKKKLEAEGLFREEYKKSIPLYAKRVGVVTASTGAAIQDIINISNRRNPYIQLILYPARVQGDGAAESIVAGIQKLDRAGVDVIIVGRGGGSIEDLWAFNEEMVARCIFSCNTPIISAVGHETDTTIADYVSDLRAPTPSAAAELAVCNINDILQAFGEYENALNQTMKRKLFYYQTVYEKNKLKLELASPMSKLQQKRQWTRDSEEKLSALMHLSLTRKKHELELYLEKMKGISPLNKLNSGYAYAVDSKGASLRSIKQVKEKESIKISVSDGEITANIEKIETRRYE
jgi:exodeoxyribonuclease VII, large subunit